jgi:hypothetical protein
MTKKESDRRKSGWRDLVVVAISLLDELVIALIILYVLYKIFF